jgi:hypothetical protein
MSLHNASTFDINVKFEFVLDKFPHFLHVLFEYFGNVTDVMALYDCCKSMNVMIRKNISFDDMLSVIASTNLPRLLRAYPDCDIEYFLNKYNGGISGSAALFLLNPPLGGDFFILTSIFLWER